MIVDNSCTCTHHRNKHTEATDGETTIRGKCEEDKCPCQSYTQLKGKVTPVQYKYLFVGTVVVVAIILSGALGVSMINISVDKTHDSYYKIWKGDVDNFDENFASYYEGNGTLSDVKEYLDRNTNEFRDSKNAGGVLIPSFVGVIVAVVLLVMMYDRERKDELLE